MAYNKSELPQNIIEQCVTYAHQATPNMKCRIINSKTNDPIYLLLNNAWDKFWNDPANYFEWEKYQINTLKSLNQGLPYYRQLSSSS